MRFSSWKQGAVLKTHDPLAPNRLQRRRLGLITSGLLSDNFATTSLRREDFACCTPLEAPPPLSGPFIRAKDHSHTLFQTVLLLCYPGMAVKVATRSSKSWDTLDNMVEMRFKEIHEMLQSIMGSQYFASHTPRQAVRWQPGRWCCLDDRGGAWAVSFALLVSANSLSHPSEKSIQDWLVVHRRLNRNVFFLAWLAWEFFPPKKKWFGQVVLLFFS